MRKILILLAIVTVMFGGSKSLASDYQIEVRTYEGVVGILRVLPDETLEEKLKSLYYEYPSIEEITTLNGKHLKDTEWSKYGGVIPKNVKKSWLADEPYRYTEPIIKVIINDEITVWFQDQQPTIKNNRVLIPLRGLFETLEAEVIWDQVAKEVTVKKGDETIVLAVNSKVAKRNHKELALDVPAQIINQRIMIPIRFVSESLGCEVSWSSNSKYVDIYYKN